MHGYVGNNRFQHEGTTRNDLDKVSVHLGSKAKAVVSNLMKNTFSNYFPNKNLFGYKYIQPYYRNEQLQYIRLILNSMRDNHHYCVGRYLAERGLPAHSSTLPKWPPRTGMSIMDVKCFKFCILTDLLFRIWCYQGSFQILVLWS